MYGDTGSNTCKYCSTLCDSCFGNGPTNCYTCVYPNVISGSTCSTTGCIAGYGVTTDPLTCVKCNNTCISCAYLNINCSSCRTTGNFTAYLYYDNVTYPKCLMSCPTEFFANSTANSCDPCNTGCSICNKTATNCTSCLATYGLLNSTCYNPCPNAYYLNVSTCAQCSKYCLICNATNISCSVCVVNGTNKSYYYNNSCIKTCPNGYFKFDNLTFGPTTCSACNTSCLKCSGDA